MSDDVIYTQLVKPAGVLRVLIWVVVLIMTASLAGADHPHGWFNYVLMLSLWAVPATLIWLLVTLITFYLFQIPALAHLWFTSCRKSAILARSAWLIIVAAGSSGFCRGVVSFFNPANDPISYTPHYWDWPAALWGALAAFSIIDWFYWHGRGRVPAATEAKLLELQARIRPHFLFNTLNSAMALVRLDPDAAETVLQNLSVLFRAALESSASHSATLEQEISLARSYLSIEAVRLGERMKVAWNVDPSTLATLIPALTLQPILENAVHHGIEPSPKGGQIQVEVRRSLGKVRIEVRNTLPPQNDAQISKGHGMALANLRARLTLMHDFEAALKTRELTDEHLTRWYCATIEVPSS